MSKLVARTKVTARANCNRRKGQFQRANQRRPRSGVKNIEGRIRNRDIKIKQLIPQSRNLDAKKNGQVVRRLVVRRKIIYPGYRPVEY